MAMKEMDSIKLPGWHSRDDQDQSERASHLETTAQVDGIDRLPLATDVTGQIAMYSQRAETTDLDAIRKGPLPPLAWPMPVKPSGVSSAVVGAPSGHENISASSPTQDPPETAANANSSCIAPADERDSSSSQQVSSEGSFIRARQMDTQALEPPTDFQPTIPGQQPLLNSTSLPRFQPSLIPIARYAMPPRAPAAIVEAENIPSEIQGAAPSPVAAIQDTPSDAIHSGSSSESSGEVFSSAAAMDDLSKKPKLEPPSDFTSDLLVENAAANPNPVHDEDEILLGKPKAATVMNSRYQELPKNNPAARIQTAETSAASILAPMSDHASQAHHQLTSIVPSHPNQRALVSSDHPSISSQPSVLISHHQTSHVNSLSSPELGDTTNRPNPASSGRPEVKQPKQASGSATNRTAEAKQQPASKQSRASLQAAIRSAASKAPTPTANSKKPNAPKQQTTAKGAPSSNSKKVAKSPKNEEEMQSIPPASNGVDPNKHSPFSFYKPLLERLNTALLEFYGMNVTQNALGERLDVAMTDSNLIQCILEQALAVFIPDHRSLLLQRGIDDWQFPSEIEQGRKRDLMDKMIIALNPHNQVAQAVDHPAFDELLLMPDLINSLALWMLAFIQRRDFRAAKDIAKFLWNLPLRSAEEAENRRLSIRAVKKAKAELDEMDGVYQTKAPVTFLFEKWKADYLKVSKKTKSSANDHAADKNTASKSTGKKPGDTKVAQPNKISETRRSETKAAIATQVPPTLQKAAVEASRKRQLDAISDGDMFRIPKKKVVPSVPMPPLRVGLSSTLNKTLYDWKNASSPSEVDQPFDVLANKHSGDSDGTSSMRDATSMQEDTYVSKPSSKGKNVRWAPGASLRRVKLIASKEERMEEFAADHDEADEDRGSVKGDDEDEDEIAQVTGNNSGLSCAYIDEVATGLSQNVAGNSQKKRGQGKLQPVADVMWTRPRRLLIPEQATINVFFSGSRNIKLNFSHRHEPTVTIPTQRGHEAAPPVDAVSQHISENTNRYLGSPLSSLES